MSRGRSTRRATTVGRVEGALRTSSRVSERRVSLGSDVDVRQLALQLVGVMREAEQGERRTFAELAKEWLAGLRRVGGTDNERRHLEHLAPLDELREGELTVAAIDGVLLGYE